MTKTKWFTLEEAYVTFESHTVATTLNEAFEKSIEKWELIVARHVRPVSDVKTCGLCDLYHATDCQDCPIRKKTGLRWCSTTPMYSDPQAELDFLKSLRDEHSKNEVKP